MQVLKNSIAIVATFVLSSAIAMEQPAPLNKFVDGYDVRWYTMKNGQEATIVIFLKHKIKEELPYVKHFDPVYSADFDRKLTEPQLQQAIKTMQFKLSHVTDERSKIDLRGAAVQDWMLPHHTKKFKNVAVYKRYVYVKQKDSTMYHSFLHLEDQTGVHTHTYAYKGDWPEGKESVEYCGAQEKKPELNVPQAPNLPESKSKPEEKKSQSTEKTKVSSSHNGLNKILYISAYSIAGIASIAGIVYVAKKIYDAVKKKTIEKKNVEVCEQT